MRKIVVTEFMTLDGVIEAPETWSFPYWNDDIAKFKQEELESSDALLLGRVTYDGFAKAWPDRKDEEGFADKMNAYPKYVVSKSLEKPVWNNTHVITDDISAEIAKLKEQDGKNVLVYGSGQLVHALLELGLADQIQLLVYPIVVGKGKRLFKEGLDAKLKLARTTSYASGVVLLVYEPER